MGSPTLTRHAEEQATRRGMRPEAVQRLVAKRAHKVRQLPAAVRIARMDYYVDAGDGYQGNEVWAIVRGTKEAPQIVTVMYRDGTRERRFTDIRQVLA